MKAFRLALGLWTAAAVQAAAVPPGAPINQSQVDQSAAQYAAQLRESKAASATVGSPVIQLTGALASPESCGAPPSSFAYGGIMTAFTAIWSRPDRDCARRRLFWDFLAVNKPAAALQALCETKDGRLAMARSHDPCEKQVVDPATGSPK